MNKMILRVPINCSRIRANEYFNCGYRNEFDTLTELFDKVDEFLKNEMDEDDETNADEFEVYDVDELCSMFNDEMLNDQDYWFIPVSIMEV